MKKTILFILLISSFYCHAQEVEKADEKAIIEKIEQLFEALEKQDSVLFESLFSSNAQIWYVMKQGDSIRTGMRPFGDDIKHFNPQRKIEESALSYEIKIHNEIAVAWVPYELSFNEKFSHCGVDVFTFLKTNGGWKIANLSYSVEPDGCASLKK